MADPTFLKHLYYLKHRYKHHSLEITPETLDALEFNFKEVGRLVQTEEPHNYHLSIANLLWEISMRSLDMLNAKDYKMIFMNAEDLHRRKNAGYAGIGAVDHWANFRKAEWFGVSAFVGCMIRMTDKFVRIGNLRANPDADQVNESIEDALYDLAIYCLIAICLWEEERDKVQCAADLIP